MDGVLEVQLYVRQVRPESFRLYTLVADNGVTSATASVAMTSSTSCPLLSASVKTQQRVPYIRDLSNLRSDTGTCTPAVADQFHC